VHRAAASFLARASARVNYPRTRCSSGSGDLNGSHSENQRNTAGDIKAEGRASASEIGNKSKDKFSFASVSFARNYLSAISNAISNRSNLSS